MSPSTPATASQAKESVSCPMDFILRMLMGPWTTYILYNLRTHGPQRFGELKRRVSGISAKMLTERLRSSILSALSHDLRTPLTRMRNQIEALQAEEPNNQKYADLLDESDRLLATSPLHPPEAGK